MSHHYFYAQKTGKTFSTFNRSPLHFKAFGMGEPTKVGVFFAEEHHLSTHFGWLTSDDKLDLIYQREDDVKIQLKGKHEELQEKGVGKIVRLFVQEITR